MVLVAHSWAAALALELARLEPERVARVVLLAPWIEPGVDPPGPAMRLAARLGPRLAFAVLRLPGVKRLLVAWNLRRAYSPDPLPPAALAHAVDRWQDSPAKVAAFLRENLEVAALLPRIKERRREVRCLVAILYGEDDRTLDARRHAEALAADLPRAELIPLADTGHMIAQTRPERVRAAIRGEAETSAEIALARYGWNPVSAQAAGEGFFRWGNEHGFVAYVRRGRRRIAAGPPIAPPEHLADLARRFEGESAERGLRVLWFGATERLRSRLPDHAAVGIGATPWFDPRGWLPSRSVRELARRARRKGVEIGEGADIEEAIRVRDAWLASKRIPPLGFLTRFPALGPGRRIFVARVEGRLVALAALARVPLRDGWLIEAIARSPEAPAGVAEALVVGIAETVAREEAGYVTLGLAPLSERGLSPGSSVVERLLRLARREAAPLYDFAGLEAFKAKFRAATPRPSPTVPPASGPMLAAEPPPSAGDLRGEEAAEGWESAFLLASGRIGAGDLVALIRAFTDEPLFALWRRWLDARRNAGTRRSSPPP